MTFPREFHGCALFNDYVWVAGGVRANTSVEIFSLATSSWTTGPSLPVPIVGGQLLVIDRKLVIRGGVDEKGENPNLNIYQLDMDNMAWVDVGNTGDPRAAFNALKWQNCTHN